MIEGVRPPILAEVIHNVEIWAAIVIIVEESDGKAKTVPGPRVKVLCHIRESAIAIVLEQNVGAMLGSLTIPESRQRWIVDRLWKQVEPISDVEIQIAVTVEISPGN